MGKKRRAAQRAAAALAKKRAAAHEDEVLLPPPGIVANEGMEKHGGGVEDALYMLAHGAKGLAHKFALKYRGNVKAVEEVRRTRMMHKDGVMSVSWHPSGTLLATGDRDGKLTVWHPKSGAKVCQRTLNGWVSAVQWSPDGKYLASGCHDGTATLWNAKTIRSVKEFSHGETVHAICWSTDSKKLCVGGYNVSVGNAPIKVWDIEIRKCIAKMVHDLHDVYSLAWQPGEHRHDHLASTSCAGKTLKVWRVKYGDCRHTFEHDDYVSDVAWSPDGDRIATASHDWRICVWGFYSGALLIEMFHDHWATCVTWSNHGYLIASGSADMSMKVWDADDGTCIRHKQYGFQINDIEFSPDDNLIAMSSRYSTEKLAKPWFSRIVLQKAPPEPEIPVEYDHRGRIINPVFGKDGKKIRKYGPSSAWEYDENAASSP